MVETYVLGLVLLGAVAFAAAVLPELLAERWASPPLFFVAFGALAFSVPHGIPAPDPIVHGDIAEKLAEFVVIVSLMGAGLKLDRPFSLRTWASTWRLLALTMPLTIAGAALLGWWSLGFVPATALLLGAVIAPTDPVLASDVQVGPPGEGHDAADESHEAREHEHETRFALTSEAGLNDGLAFPFTYAAILVAGSGFAGADWLGKWGGMYVGYKILVGVVSGLLLGYLFAQLLFRFSPTTRLAEAVEGAEILGGTLLIYAITELVQGYGFIAVFVAALLVRHYERSHDYNQALHDFSEVTERLAMAVLLTLFGGALATGLLSPLTWEVAAVGLVLLFVLRPLAGALGLVGSPLERNERTTIAFFGIRGIGSFYYLAYALNKETFAQSELLWALVGFVALVSIVVHGIAATPVMERLARHDDA
ncbi:cation:proton antiporter [Halomicroarcula limicola]|uniref:Cation:proton antiporter n=1 Tax=Haloarcula limicola TaxID=1429915 RepID=A0A8J7Y8Y8_9EURY|nr:cation:proton antiporter [Halomicroarcula limicola]MBV0924271.1 cation:proton antiporter [Halomicroarcula limicola]